MQPYSPERRTALVLCGTGAHGAYHAGALRAIQEEALARLDRSWDDLPMSWVPEVPPDHPYAVDLDIVGRASLFQLLDTTATRMGRESLAAWLLAPADPTVATVVSGRRARTRSRKSTRRRCG